MKGIMCITTCKLNLLAWSQVFIFTPTPKSHKTHICLTQCLPRPFSLNDWISKGLRPKLLHACDASIIAPSPIDELSGKKNRTRVVSGSETMDHEIKLQKILMDFNKEELTRNLMFMEKNMIQPIKHKCPS